MTPQRKLFILKSGNKEQDKQSEEVGGQLRGLRFTRQMKGKVLLWGCDSHCVVICGGPVCGHGSPV